MAMSTATVAFFKSEKVTQISQNLGAFHFLGKSTVVTAAPG